MGLLAQSAERGANNAKVVSLTLAQPKPHIHYFCPGLVPFSVSINKWMEKGKGILLGYGFVAN